MSYIMSYRNQNINKPITLRTVVRFEGVSFSLFRFFPNKMAPNTQDEQVKTCELDIEAKDRLKLKNDGYLWQKVDYGYCPDHSVESNKPDSLTLDHKRRP